MNNIIFSETTKSRYTQLTYDRKLCVNNTMNNYEYTIF
jgi:hypothetical protein